MAGDGGYRGRWTVEEAWGTPGAPPFVAELAGEVAARHGLVCADPHADGWTTVAAVPLEVTGRTAAVLVLGRRHGPGFGADVLAEVGGVAAVAAARLDGELARERLAELDRRADLDRRTAELGGVLLDEALDALAADEPSAARLTEAIGRHFGAPCRLLDARLRLVAGRLPADPGEFRRRVRAALDGIVEPDLTVVAVRGGVLVLGTTVDARRRPDLVRVARLCSLAVRRAGEVSRAHAQVRGELLGELLAARGPLPAGVCAVAAMRSFDVDAPHVVVALTEADPVAVADTAALFGGLGGRHGEHVLAVLPGDDPSVAGLKVTRQLAARGADPGAVCVSAPVVPRTGGLAEAGEEAVHGAGLLAALGVTGQAMTADDLVLYRTLFDQSNTGELRRFVNRTLEPLTRYDRAHRGDLLRTVQYLVTNNGNATRAAKQLFIHPNTMGKRLDRIGRLLGSDWQSGPFNVHLRLALHLESLGVDVSAA
ncbi:PucR family transcriptional regulator [Actinoplanes solisilvae]|uniref:PucR family transcriptional regulator n=1 Tax=Actinoplanes solisilvae TaxID=2486853 RepID=UPI000FDB8F4E|nr:helix-turn-helix domain-containing protein [Actinoplanes solisilvae]